jgi:hypothetical protein
MCMNKLNKLLNKLRSKDGLLMIVILVLILFICSVGLRVNAKSTGTGIGVSIGGLTGKAVGSYEGMTQGSIEGAAAGKTAGLSAEDTKAQIVTQLSQANKLEVLVASVKLNDFHTIGEDEHPDYAALYLMKGNVVFSVDLSNAKISFSGNTLHIKLSEPDASLYFTGSPEKIAEYQKHSFSGSAEDGYDAYLNSMEKIQSATLDDLSNKDDLISAAKKSAENQIELLVKSASVTGKNISVEWAD